MKKDYGNRAYSMYFILPDEGVSLQSVISELNGEKWNDLKNEMSNYYQGEIRFPKFRIDCNLNISGGDKYEARGVKEILMSPELVEMTDKRIRFLQVIQNNTVEVEEGGSKAAVVTIVNVSPTSPRPNDPLIPIDINRPFMFVIEEYSTGTILFAGTIVNM